MKNKHGFIAISLIYSFFLVFLMTLVTILTNYTHNRILLNGVKTKTQEYLNGLSEFNPIGLENKTYNKGDYVFYANTSWKVIKDNGNSVVLIKAVALSSGEIQAAVANDKESSFSTSVNRYLNNNTVPMCFPESVGLNVCKYIDNNDYIPYQWEISIVYKIVNDFLYNNALLQKAQARGTLLPMEFYDNTKEYDGSNKKYNEFIRIPTSDEYSDSGIWSLTMDSFVPQYGSYIKIGTSSFLAHSTKLAIQPVITVKKIT